MEREEAAMEGMSEAMEAAAFHGIASNPAFPCADRLACALKALDFYAAAYPDEVEV